MVVHLLLLFVHLRGLEWRTTGITLPWLQVRYIEWSVLEDRVLHHVSGYYRHELLYDLVSTRSHLNAKHRAAARQNNPAEGRWEGG